MSSFTKSDAYQSYSALAKRPLGMAPWEEDEDGIMIAAGEKFCRYNVGIEDEVELCDTETPFSHTGNLKHHVKGHGVAIKEVRKGVLSSEEQRETKRFYRQVMENHQKLVDAATNEESNEGHEPPVLGATPTPWKASTSVAVRLVLASLAKDQEQQEAARNQLVLEQAVAEPAIPEPATPKQTVPEQAVSATPRLRRPYCPRKQDGTINKAQMHRDLGLKGSSRCDRCKEAKRACPAEDDDCLVVAQYTDEGED